MKHRSQTLVVHKRSESKIMEKKEIIAEIQSKTQFVITVTIFFLAILQNFFRMQNDEMKSIDIFLKYSLVVVFYLVFYLIFEWRKGKLTSYWLNKVRFLVILGIGFTIFPILTIITSLKAGATINLINVGLYLVSLWGIFIVPIILMFGLSIEALIGQAKKWAFKNTDTKLGNYLIRQLTKYAS